MFCLSNKDLGDGFWEKQFTPSQINHVLNTFTSGHGGAVNHVTEVLMKNYGLNKPETLPVTLDRFFAMAS